MAHNLLTTAEVAARLRTPEATCRYWRYTGYGPKWIKVGRRALYDEEDVERFLDDLVHRAGSSSS